MAYFLIAILVWNLIVMAVYAVDKAKAINGAWRISERVLLSLSFLLGAVGAILGMQIFRHKTKKLKFMLVYLFLAINIVVVLLICYFAFGFVF